MTDADHALEVFTRDLSSGRIHKRFWVPTADRTSGRYVVDERCNLDQAGAYEVIASLADVETEALCGHCFEAPGHDPREESIT